MENSFNDQLITAEPLDITEMSHKLFDLGLGCTHMICHSLIKTDVWAHVHTFNKNGLLPANRTANVFRSGAALTISRPSLERNHKQSAKTETETISANIMEEYSEPKQNKSNKSQSKKPVRNLCNGTDRNECSL